MPFFVLYIMVIERPTYLISEEICRANIRRMAEKALRSGVVFRPHFKTHQSLAIGRWFREAGITRITVSSITAADYFSKDGWDDITVAFPVNLRELARINDLAGRVNLGLLLEHPEVAGILAKSLEYPVDAYIKIDSGYHRTGLGPDEMPVIRELASALKANDLFRLAGVLTHAGHTYQASSPVEVRKIYSSASQILNTIASDLSDIGNGLIRSWGDTPSCSLMDEFSGVDEIRPGNFIFYDLMQHALGSCEFSHIAGIAVCPVVAVHSSRNQAIIYGGAIHLSKEYLLVDHRKVYGQLVEVDENGWYDPIPDAWLISLSQEHGVVEAPAHVISHLHPGKYIGIVPVHACLTANLLQGYQLLEGGFADYLPGN